ncbi:restriction endonuclease subunit S [Alcaligenaceae bacterium]|nr:restriction endonuclease subunit S [Alcaligenaceae bacterium]
MDAQQFLAEFGHIANSPEGVDQLRELILHLAVTGDLISTDAPVDASPLLDSIEKQKREHPDRKKVITKQASISRAAIKAPPHWAVCRIGDLALTITGGGTPSKSHPTYWGGSIPWASVKDLRELKFIDDTEDHITEEGLKNSSSNLIPPGRVIVCTRMGLGKVAINRIALAINQDLKALELPNEVNTDFFLILYKTREVKGTGTTVSGIKQDQLLALPAALPPLEEQSRIAAKVDELMALCDKLEAQQQARHKLQNALRQSTLQAVASSQSPHELQTTWTRLADNFERLFHAPEDVAELRGLVLDMAMRGYLVEQDPMEESATVLCAHIEDKKRQISKDRKLKLQKSLPQIGEDEIPFNVPSGWAWIRLGQIAELINGDRGKNYPNKDEYVSVGVPWINTGHIEPDGTLTKHHMNFISREKFESLNSGKIEPGDLVYCLRGATFGKTAFVTPYEEGAIASSLMIIRPIISSLSRFLYYYLISPLGRSQIFRFDNGTAQPNLSANSVGLFSYPLPPLQEQIRIADKIEQLMRVCDALELQLRQATEVAGRFSVAAVSSLTGIAIEQEEEPMKAPQTELIAPLRLGTAPDIKTQAPLATILARHNGEMSAKDLWQRFGGEIDAFYAQLKTEVAHGWILEPAPAEMREKAADTAIA